MIKEQKDCVHYLICFLILLKNNKNFYSEQNVKLGKYIKPENFSNYCWKKNPDDSFSRVYHLYV